MNTRRKSDVTHDLGLRIHAIKTNNPELAFSAIAERLGYSRNRVMQAYGKWLRKKDAGEIIVRGAHPKGEAV